MGFSVFLSVCVCLCLCLSVCRSPPLHLPPPLSLSLSLSLLSGSLSHSESLSFSLCLFICMSLSFTLPKMRSMCCYHIILIGSRETFSQLNYFFGHISDDGPKLVGIPAYLHAIWHLHDIWQTIVVSRNTINRVQIAQNRNETVNFEIIRNTYACE